MRHTYATLELPERTYYEVKKALIDAGGQEHRFNNEGEIDMSGLAVVVRGVEGRNYDN